MWRAADVDSEESSRYGTLRKPDDYPEKVKAQKTSAGNTLCLIVHLDGHRQENV